MDTSIVPSIEVELAPPYLADSTWVIYYENKQWPVLICDEKILPREFIDSRIKPYDMPAIVLGRHKYIWVNNKQLKLCDPDYNYLAGLEPFQEPEIQDNDSVDIRNEKKRRVAFKQDAPLCRNTDYWHNYIMNASEARKLEAAIRRKHNATTSKPPPKSQLFIEDSSDEDDTIAGVERKKLARSGDAAGDIPTCTIYIGPDSFPVTPTAITACPYLNTRQEPNRLTGGSIIDLTKDPRSLARNLTAQEFIPVWSYMKTGNIGPKLLLPTTNSPNPPTVSKLDQLPHKKAAHVEHLGKTFITASKIRHTQLQDVIVQKLQALHPLPPLSLLILAAMANRLPSDESDAERELGVWIVKHIADYYWTIVGENADGLRRILADSEDLRAGVYKRLAADSQAGMKGL